MRFISRRSTACRPNASIDLVDCRPFTVVYPCDFTGKAIELTTPSFYPCLFCFNFYLIAKAIGLRTPQNVRHDDVVHGQRRVFIGILSSKP